MTRDSFVFYRSFYEAVGHLGDADRLACYDAIARYGLDGTCEADGVSAAIMAIVKPILDANNRRYENGKKGGRKPNQNQTKTKLEPSNNQAETTSEPNVKCKMLNVNVNDKDINNRSPRFKKPTVEEIKAYCIERQNDVDPQRFFDHYEANGWKVGGKSAMKDWKACVRTWEKNEIKVPSRPKSFQNQRVYDYNALENELLQKARAGT